MLNKLALSSCNVNNTTIIRLIVELLGGAGGAGAGAGGALLSAAGCDYAQGYVLGHAKPAAQFVAAMIATR